MLYQFVNNFDNKVWGWELNKEDNNHDDLIKHYNSQNYHDKDRSINPSNKQYTI